MTIPTIITIITNSRTLTTKPQIKKPASKTTMKITTKTKTRTRTTTIILILTRTKIIRNSTRMYNFFELIILSK
jgi:hypothetical protein